MKTKIKFFGLEIEGYHAGVVCIGLGVSLLLAAAHISRAGRETEISRNLPTLVTPLAAAEVQQPPEDPTVQPPDAQPPAATGWVYLGPEGEAGEWVFSPLHGPAESIAITPDGTIMRAERTVPLRENHYGDWTGTFIGALLGQDKPRILERLTPGACVRVLEGRECGFRLSLDQSSDGYVYLNQRRRRFSILRTAGRRAGVRAAGGRRWQAQKRGPSGARQGTLSRGLGSRAAIAREVVADGALPGSLTVLL